MEGRRQNGQTKGIISNYNDYNGFFDAKELIEQFGKKLIDYNRLLMLETEGGYRFPPFKLPTLLTLSYT